MNAASYGPWFVNYEGANVVKRECFDEFGEHCGYQLLDGEYDAVANAAAAAPAMLAALKCAQAIDAPRPNGAFVLVSYGWNRSEETGTAFVARMMREAIDSAEGR